MKVYVFEEKGALAKVGMTGQEITDLLDALAADTDTTDLVVAIYLLRRTTDWEAHSLTEPIGPEDFCRVRGERDYVGRFGTPAGLPGQFQLVRIALGVRRRYPTTETDIYDWEMSFERFEDHLAYTFAHELHHFRRYRLGFHGGEGEQTTCKWALERAQKAGFNVSGMRLKVKKRRKARKKPLALPVELRPGLLRRVRLSSAHLCAEDLKELDRWIRRRLDEVNAQKRKKKVQTHFEKLRALPEGAPLIIKHDDDAPGYTGQTALKVRNLRRPSPRMQIRTADGQEWFWLMKWLEVLEVPRPAAAEPLPDEESSRSQSLAAEARR